jgi:signal transduction histidine kinase
VVVRPTGAPLRGRTRYPFLWIALVPIALSAAAVWLSGQYREEVAWITHTYDVRSQVRDIVQTMADAEDSLRDYVVTGSERSSRAIDADAIQARRGVGQLRSLTSDNPVQQVNLRTLQPLIERTIAEMQDARRQAIHPGARAETAATSIDQGQQSLNRIRSAARGMMEEEERLLLTRSSRESRTSREVEAIFVAAILLTLALLVWAGRRLREYAEQRDRAESALEGTVHQIEALNHALEARVEERTAQLRDANSRLERSNEDLARFAFIASHDLQEPLRMVTLFSQLLERNYRGTLGADGSTYLNNIIAATHRMRELLRSLLAYAEVGVQPEETALPVDLNAVVDKAMQNLQTSIDETGAVITCGQLPVLRVNEGHFIQLFQNLIGNAIKYRGQQPPRIHISVTQADGHLRFSVTDNGIGIEPEYHEKIFVAFKRLHGLHIPGTGIGLAICKRALYGYGGRIWVESDAGKGATFLFALPAALRCDAPSQQAVS